jgi:hypothetical protein
MRQPALLLPIALALGAAILVPGRGVQAAPIAITTCQTISQAGSYVLANQIEVLGSPCLTITASLVTIDLAGFVVTARSSPGIIARSSLGPIGGITVRNGKIFLLFEGGTALDLAAADGSVVEGLHALGGGIVAKGIVRGNTVSTHFGSGISASGIVTDNYVSGNVGGVGIEASGTVRGNTVIGVQGFPGIVVGAGSTVIGNTATGNTIGIQADCPSNLTDNTAVNNGTNLVLNGDGCHNEDNVAP